MRNQTRQQPTMWITCGIILSGLIIAGVTIGIYILTPVGESTPSVRILQPSTTLGIESGQAVVLVARAESSSGIQNIEFLVNDIPVDVIRNSDAQQYSLDTAFPWFSSQPGIHKLSVIAHDNIGKASQPASVLVVVNARTEQGPTPENTSVDSNGGPSGAGGQPSAVSAGSDQAAINQAIQGVDIDGEFPVNLPNQPQDIPPLITSFEIRFERDGESINGTYVISSTDDLGIAFVKFFVANMEDPIQPASTQLDCNSERVCTTDGHFHLPRGGWILSTQAVDTSGQVSQIHAHQIQILDGQGPPAIAQEDDNIMFQVDPRAAINDAQIIDMQAVDEPARAELPAGEAAAPLVPENCLNLAIIPVEESCRVDGTCEAKLDLEITCPIILPENVGMTLSLSYRDLNMPMNLGNVFFGGVSNPPEWNEPGRRMVDAGTHFQKTDYGQCETTIRVVAGLSLTNLSNPGHGNYPISTDETIFTYPVCPPQSPGANLSLTASEDSQGVLVQASFSQNWQANFAVDTVKLQFYRYQLGINHNDLLWEQSIAVQNLPGQIVQTIDQFHLPCSGGESHVYTAIGWGPDNLILFKTSTPAPRRECNPGDPNIPPIQVQFEPNSRRVDFMFDIPSAHTWPQGDNVWLKLMYYAGVGVPQEAWGIKITPALLNGYHVDASAEYQLNSPFQCGDVETVFYLALFVNGQQVDQGPIYNVRTADCAPQAPELTSLQATSNCSEGSPCILITWKPNQPPLDGRYQPVEKIVILRWKGDYVYTFTPGEQRATFYIPAHFTQFEDNQVEPDQTYTYRLFYAGEDGSLSTFSQLNIHTPEQLNWDLVSTDFQQDR